MGLIKKILAHLAEQAFGPKKEYKPSKSSLFLRGLSEWTNLAESKLIQFLKENPNSIDGFRYIESYNSSDDPNYEFRTIRALPNGRFYIEISGPSFDGHDDGVVCVSYGHCKDHYVKNSGPYVPREGDGFSAEYMVREFFPEFDDSLDWGDLRKSIRYTNQYRNRFVGELKEKTGFDLKKAVAKSKKGK